jgi:predicted 3-demethylubiquinone-9 3-methyltransferase (glyoxalase superfamily)
MKEKITTCLWFNGQAKEAATLYCSVFDNAKITAQSPIVTAIDVSGHSITLLDGGPKYQPNPSISFYYICEDAEELNRIWNAFSKEGAVMMALDKYPWGEKYGWITDKYGISWQLALGRSKDNS